MIWIFVNLPPQESTSYCGIETNGVVLLEEELVRLQSLYPDHKVIPQPYSYVCCQKICIQVTFIFWFILN